MTSSHTSLHLANIRKWFFQSPPIEWAYLNLRNWLLLAIRQGPVPQHIAFVMDGNRRFARLNNIESIEGHSLGFEALVGALEICYKTGVKVVTVYAFSIDNFKRSRYEVDQLMDLAKTKLAQFAHHGEILEQYGAKVQFLGNRDLIRPDVLEVIDKAIALTSENGGAILNICAPYTSQDEITTAIRNTVIEYSRPIVSPVGKTGQFPESHITQHIQSQTNKGCTNTLAAPHVGDREDHLSTQRQQHKDAHAGGELNRDSGTNTQESCGDGGNNKDYDTGINGTRVDSSAPNSPLSHVCSHSDRNRSSSAKEKSQSSPDSSLDSSSRLCRVLDPQLITTATLNKHTFTGSSCPPLDIVIRTSGVDRLSDFMLWQCNENTELVMINCMWPEFDLLQFLPIILEWQWRHHRTRPHRPAHPHRRKQFSELKMYK